MILVLSPPLILIAFADVLYISPSLSISQLDPAPIKIAFGLLIVPVLLLLRVTVSEPSPEIAFEPPLVLSIHPQLLIITLSAPEFCSKSIRSCAPTTYWPSSRTNVSSFTHW